MNTPKLEFEIQKILRISKCSDCQAMANYLKAKNPCRTRIKAHKIYQLIARKMKEYIKKEDTVGVSAAYIAGAKDAFDFLKNGGK